MGHIVELLGKTITSIKQDRDELIFICSDNKKYKMHHSQDCCESVSIEDIVGDLNDLIGHPILTVSEDTNCKTHPDGFKNSEYSSDSFTWTFYNLATINGHVTIRWYGTSNGYYSESVSFDEIIQNE